MELRFTRREALAGLAATFAAPAVAQPALEPEVPYVPTPRELVEKMLDLAEVGASDYLIDLGCGDGRIAIAAAKRGARALGVDIDGQRIRQAQAAARMADAEVRVRFRRQDLFETPIHEASVIALYLLPEVNLRLRPRLLTELSAGARVVSHAFDMGDWQPDAREELDGRRIFLWHVPAVAGGSWELSRADGSLHLLELEQRFQKVSGTISGAGVSRPVTGDLRGSALRIASGDGAVQIDGRMEADSIVPASGAEWRAVRLG